MHEFFHPGSDTCLVYAGTWQAATRPMWIEQRSAPIQGDNFESIEMNTHDYKDVFGSPDTSVDQNRPSDWEEAGAPEGHPSTDNPFLYDNIPQGDCTPIATALGPNGAAVSLPTPTPPTDNPFLYDNVPQRDCSPIATVMSPNGAAVSMPPPTPPTPPTDVTFNGVHTPSIFLDMTPVRLSVVEETALTPSKAGSQRRDRARKTPSRFRD